MQNQAKSPIISKELISYLDSLFPEKCADLRETDRENIYKSGQRSVVNHLIEKRKLQQEI
jgi:hypothetical protein